MQGLRGFPGEHAARGDEEKHKIWSHLAFDTRLKQFVPRFDVGFRPAAYPMAGTGLLSLPFLFSTATAELPDTAVLSAVNDYAFACDPTGALGDQEDGDIGNLVGRTQSPPRNRSLNIGVQLWLALFHGRP